MTRISNSHSVLAIGPPKEAALYFDRVFPVDFGHAFLGSVRKSEFDPANFIPFDGARFSDAVVQSLLPDVDKSSDIYKKIVEASFAFLVLDFLAEESLRKDFVEGGQFRQTTERVLSLVGLSVDECLARIASDPTEHDKYMGQVIDSEVLPLIEKTGFASSPMWTDVTPDRTTQESVADRFLATLSGLSIVDPARVPWDALVEFRKDEASRKALRDLRLYFSENFSDKDVSYASDKLASAMDRYQATAKIWGFELVQRSLSVVFSKDTAIAAGLSALTATGLGAPIGITAVAGAAMALGPGVLELGKVLIDHKKEALDRPLRYLADLKKLESK